MNNTKRSAWELERQYHCGRPSSLHYIYDAFDTTKQGHYGATELFHLTNAVRQFVDQHCQRQEMRPALESMFNKAATTKEGHMYPKDIQAMITSLSKNNSEIVFVDCNDETANILVAALDEDQNGSVEMEEFVSWLISGMSKSKEHRMKFSERGEKFAMLIQFMESVMEVAKKMTNKVKNKKRQRRSKISLDIATQIVRDLDEDGNGQLEYVEFRHWLVGSMTKEKGDASRTRTQDFIQFQKSLCCDILDMNTILMERALQELYELFDVDKSKTMDATELVAWMKDIHRMTGSTTMVPDSDMASRVIEFLDRDKSGTIESDEWIVWLREGQRILFDSKQKDMFLANSGDMGLAILDFLDMVVLQAAKKTKDYVESLQSAYMYPGYADDDAAADDDDQTTGTDQKALNSGPPWDDWGEDDRSHLRPTRPVRGASPLNQQSPNQRRVTKEVSSSNGGRKEELRRHRERSLSKLPVIAPEI